MSAQNLLDQPIEPVSKPSRWDRQRLRQQFLTLAASTPVVTVFYMIYLIVAEILTTFANPVIGLAFHAAMVFMVLFHATWLGERQPARLLLCIMLMPLIRLMSVSVPLANFPPVTWYLVVSIPLFLAAFTVMRLLGLKWGQVGFNLRAFPFQIMVAVTGILLGVVEYMILRPLPILYNPTLWQIVEPAIYLLIGTGLMEELVFRGVLQQVAEEHFGTNPSILFSAAVFAIMHIGWQSALDLLMVFIAGVYWGWIFARTRSIFGITISHGITNIMLFLILPLTRL
jgi:hypothetical protein